MAEESSLIKGWKSSATRHLIVARYVHIDWYNFHTISVRRCRVFEELTKIVVPTAEGSMTAVAGQRMQCRTTHKRKDC